MYLTISKNDKIAMPVYTANKAQAYNKKKIFTISMNIILVLFTCLNPKPDYKPDE